MKKSLQLIAAAVVLLLVLQMALVNDSVFNEENASEEQFWVFNDKG